MIVLLGLGANLGDRRCFLKNAIAELTSRNILSGITHSSLYESEAVLLPDSPPEWNLPYLNMAVKGTTVLSPDALLVAIKNIEQALGRQDRGVWSPREIDLDILAYGEEIISLPHLIIPHAYLLERPFALLPFAELSPEWRFPIEGKNYGKSAKELALNLASDGTKKLDAPL